MKNLEVTPNISLHPIQLEDAPVIFQVVDNQRDYLGKWLPFVPLTKEQKNTENFINSVINTPEDKREHTFVIRYNGEFAGIIGYRGTDRQNKKTELGYWLSESYQGKGIITQAVRFLIEFTFNELDMNRLMIRCAIGNEKSKKIPRSLNFKFEGVERAGELLSDGNFADLEVYSLLKGEAQ